MYLAKHAATFFVSYLITFNFRDKSRMFGVAEMKCRENFDERKLNKCHICLVWNIYRLKSSLQQQQQQQETLLPYTGIKEGIYLLLDTVVFVILNIICTRYNFEWNNIYRVWTKEQIAIQYTYNFIFALVYVFKKSQN